MVIQRLQSLFLFFASVIMGIFCFMPFANNEAGGVFYPENSLVFLSVNILIALLLMLSIFMFRNLRRQKTVVLVSMLLMVASAVTGSCTIYTTMENPQLAWDGGALMLLCSMLLTVAAYRRIVADEKLLKSYDRLR